MGQGPPQYNGFGQYVDTTQPGSGSPYGGPGGGAAWDADLAKRIQAQADAQMARSKGILGRGAPGVYDTNAEFGQLQQSRGQQAQALDYLQNQAMGLGPSVARAQTGQQLGAALGQMGPGGNALSQRALMLGGNQALGSASLAGAQARGNEMGNALGAYGAGAQGMRQGDVQGQQAAMQNALRQRQLALLNAKQNASLAQNYEGMDMDRNFQNTQASQQFYNTVLGKEAAQNDNNAKTTGATMQALAAAGMMAGMMASDARYKMEVR